MPNVMLHIDETLDADARHALLDQVKQQFGIEAASFDSSKPHLLFLPANPRQAPPHAVLDAVRARGYHAQIVDL